MLNSQNACFGFRFILLSLSLSVSVASCAAQNIDGLVDNLQQLVGKPIVVVPERGAVESGTLTEILQPKDGPVAIVHLEFKSERGRSRRFKPDQIRDLRIGGRQISLFRNLPSKTYQLVDQRIANEVIDIRLKELNCKRSNLYEEEDYNRLSKSALSDIRKAVGKLPVSKQMGLAEGDQVILVSDYPARQRGALIQFLDPFVRQLNEVFGFRDDSLVLPGKPVIAIFASRGNLGSFQSNIANNPNYGTIRSFFHLVDGHVVVTAEDDRSVKHACWQAAWGLSGAYARFSYSDVVLPAWIRVGLQQHCADLLVPGLANHRDQRQRVIQQINGGSLNGLLRADRLPVDRQIVCKQIVAHLYQLNPEAFGQMVSFVKQGRTTDDALAICYGMNEDDLASSFGRTIGFPNLTP